MMNPVEALQKVLKGEMSSEEFSKITVAYLDSPEWQRRKAKLAAEDLKDWKLGQERLLALIDQARADGYRIETEFRPLKEGHRSTIVTIEGCMTGFPSWFGVESVEMNFAELRKHATPLRDARKNGGASHGS